MNVPVELVVLLLSCNGAVLTIACHLLLSILKQNTAYDKRISLMEYQIGLRPKTANQE